MSDKDLDDILTTRKNKKRDFVNDDDPFEEIYIFLRIIMEDIYEHQNDDFYERDYDLSDGTKIKVKRGNKKYENVIF